jgi:hypothetical protein
MAGLLLYAVYGIANRNSEAGMAAGMVDGFRLGLIMGILGLSLINIIKLTRTLRDDKRIKMYYNQINDERMKAIRSKAGMPLLLQLSVLMLIAGIIAGYFSKTVFLTLIITAAVQLSIGVIIKFFYMNKM